MATKWKSLRPEQCDICHEELKKVFIDGRTVLGPWAILCEGCHTKRGCGLGVDHGQKYDLETLECLEGDGLL